MSLLETLNQEYLKLHQEKESQFWSQKMGHQDYQKGTFETAEQAFKEWISNPKYMSDIQDALDTNDLNERESIGLKGWQRFFDVNAINDPEALEIQKELIAMEGDLEQKRLAMTLGYRHPKTGKFVKSSYGELSAMTTVNDDESLRKAAWEGLVEIAQFILKNGFIDIIKKRNQLARKLGFEDYYDYKVQLNEGFSKKKLFEILDDLEEKTRETCKKSVEEVVEEHGKSAAYGWNFAYVTAGDLTKDMDPYFSFSDAFSRWSKSFAAMNISYNNATIQLDLLEREGKYHNGFMHGPTPAFRNGDSYIPAEINFTANALPNQVGSGMNAFATLFHEGGHAAHFANIDMPAPCFSQEFAPTSVAFAETQSMFLDSLIGDADWQTRYAKNSEGETIPFELIEKKLRHKHRFLAKGIRGMLAVSYAEKALYELPEDQLTFDDIHRVVDEVERRLHFQEIPFRKVLCIPHIISGEASAYYHGYILAEMAVYQTRDYFLKKYGHIVDNPEIGRELEEVYWKCGNSKNFLQLVEELTGEAFSARATAEQINQAIEDLIANAKKSIEFLETIPEKEETPNLGGTIRLVHGDTVIADSSEESLEEMSDTFRSFVDKTFPKK